MLAPETNGEVAVKAWAGARQDHGPRPHAPRRCQARTRRSASATSGAAAQDHLLADLVGHRERAGLLQRRLDQRARTDPVAHAHRPPAALPGPSLDARLRRGALRLPAAGRHSRPSQPMIETQRRTATPHVVLNFITPHQKWGIHSTYTDNLLMLTLSAAAGRSSGSPRWTRRRPASSITTGSRLYNANGALIARAVVSQRDQGRHGASCITPRRRS